MADLVDLAKLLTSTDDKTIAASDPYASFQEIPQLINATALQGKGYSTKDRIIAGLLGGFAGGALGQFSENYQTKAKKDYKQILNLTAAGVDLEDADSVSKLREAGVNIPDFSDVDSSVFKAAKEQGDIFRTLKVAGELDAVKEAALKSQEMRDKAYLEEGFVKNLKTGEYELDPRIDPLEKAIRIEAAKKRLEGASDKSKFKLGVEATDRLGKSKAVIDEALYLSNEFYNSPDNKVETQLAFLFPNLDESGRATQLKNLADSLTRAKTGAALNTNEQKVYKELTRGNIISDAKTIANILRKLAESESRLVKSQIDFAYQLQTGGYEGAKEAFDLPIDTTSFNAGKQTNALGIPSDYGKEQANDIQLKAAQILAARKASRGQ